ncbi:hypothetical protein ISF_05020 [Cordyceps fumosorosea ARSEF 2679]|uniref:Uncharacterized protein n=1 Tax=Cordyceps fumosorosea (strain ARSEF 2679) TaxID=1081104 RepID=A0A167VZA6_CORFA|nr:hypothetical protein ISF_05020 [Cordyceps fumosorosea ARSEF 2679]OAA63144.1 hypothetical protein ISF_05020 [Cordyceps fumosorosea ARSEF 2679]
MTPNSTTATAASEATTYYLLPDLRAIDPGAAELDLAAHAWVCPIVIEDEDLMFGGKSLSALYEEERRRRSSGGGSIAGNSSSDEESLCGDEEERGEEQGRRGRERVRRRYVPAKSHRK